MAAAAGMPDALARICASTRQEVLEKQEREPLRELKQRARAVAEPTRGFARVLHERTARREVGLIAEMKRRSPSGGDILPEFDPRAIARNYADAGACCLSVLTEPHFFGGRPEDLGAAREAGLPVLRKDFILDPWQVYESRLMGADCVLLIMAALADAEARELNELARSLELDVLVEAHDAAELDRALGLDAALVGINNRNLRTLRTDLATTELLAPRVPPDRIVVSESGIGSRADVERMARAGASCFLVGESLLRQPDPGAACAALLGPLPREMPVQGSSARGSPA